LPFEKFEGDEVSGAPHHSCEPIVFSARIVGRLMKPLFLFLGTNLQRLVRLGPAGLLAFVWFSTPGIAGLFLLYELGMVSDWLHARGDAALLLYAVVFMVTSGIGLLPTTAQAVLGGWVFGPAKGLSAACLAFGGAALLGLLITRAVAGKRIERLFETKREARAIRDALIGKGFLQTTLMVALLRLPPQSPFAFTNFVMVSCGVAAAPFLLGTVLGMIPRTLVVMLLASAAAQTGAEDIQAFVREGPGWPVVAGGLALVAVVMSIIGAIARRALIRLHVDPAAFR
jgi:uncharacterized membrane protein YdjX (TVP38/TMEM64 family)